jgi:hypothetical protein
MSGEPVELTLERLKRLLASTLVTREVELTCEESGALVHRYIEHRLGPSASPLPADLRLVEEHLALCPACRDELEATIRALRQSPG